MPSQPVWFDRLPSILKELRAVDGDYLDRHAIERIFGVRQRRARQLMAGLSTLHVGNAVAVSRSGMIARLEAASPKVGAQKPGSAPVLEVPAAPVKDNLLLQIALYTILYPGELRIRFTDADDLAAKLSTLHGAVRTDWKALVTKMRTAPATASKEREAAPEPANTHDAELELRRLYYPQRWERWSK